MAKKSAAPLLGEPAVKELLAVMAEHNAPGQKDLLAMLQQIAGMEKQLGAAMEELAAMRRELAEAERQRHPIANTLRKAVIVMQAQVLDLRDKLGQLRTAVIDGCKKAVAAFRAHGVSALAHTADFFHVRPALESIGRELDKSIAQDNKAITAIEAASKEYHAAGFHLKNALRAVTGREPVAEPKGPGAISRVLSAPFRAERTLFTSMKGRAEGALKRLERLEEAERPPIRKTMEEMGAKAAKERQSKEKAAPAVKRDER